MAVEEKRASKQIKVEKEDDKSEKGSEQQLSHPQIQIINGLPF